MLVPEPREQILQINTWHIDSALLQVPIPANAAKISVYI